VRGGEDIRRGERIVCDLKAFVKKNDHETLVLEAVNHISVVGGEVYLRNLFGEEHKVKGVVREVSLAKNKVIIEQA